MSRIQKVQNYVNGIFVTIPNEEEKRVAYSHTYGVAQLMVLLAKKRALNVEIATIIGLLHDLYAYKTGVRSLHSHNGAEMVRVAFNHELAKLFQEEEQTIITSAIYHHSDKEHVHDAYDELLKDSDVLQHYLYDISLIPLYSPRLYKVALEMGMDVSSNTETKDHHINKPFQQQRAADIAEMLIAKGITGERQNEVYRELIKYYPETSAFDELHHGWCAAFVYHCLLEAGLVLPLRTPHTAKNRAQCRFACVVAWYEWAAEHGYCNYEKDHYTPQRGDIVIYNNIIPKDDKSEHSTWCDHIGIILSSDQDTITVAEGNIGNKNTAGIIKRKRDHTIGCYIRIPEDYEYIEWQIDFKTGTYRVENFTLKDKKTEE